MKKDVKVIEIFKVLLITLFILLIFKQMKEYVFFKNISDNNNVVKEKVLSISFRKNLELYTYKDQNSINVKLSEIYNIKTETEKYIIYSNNSCDLLKDNPKAIYIWPSKEKNHIYLSEEEKNVWRVFKGRIFNCYSFLYNK